MRRGSQQLPSGMAGGRCLCVAVPVVVHPHAWPPGLPLGAQETFRRVLLLRVQWWSDRTWPVTSQHLSATLIPRTVSVYAGVDVVLFMLGPVELYAAASACQ